MKKSIILLSSILLFWACKENVESTPACNPKAIPALKQHMVGNWNLVSTDQYRGIKTTVKINADGNYESPIELFEIYYSERRILLDFHKWSTVPREPNNFYMEAYDKDVGPRSPTRMTPMFTSCDRMDFISDSGNIFYFYKDGYKIQPICGADTSKGFPENWIVGKWKYSIVENPLFPKSIVSPKGNVEFKDDFTVVDSNPLGILSSLSYLEGGPNLGRMMWFGDRRNKDVFYLYADDDKDDLYNSTSYGNCIFESIACDKIVFRSTADHIVTLDRVK